MAGNQAIIIVILVCCFCVILPLVIYGSLWGTNTLCDKESSEKQEWIGMDCPSVYTGTAETPSPEAPSPTTDPRSEVWALGQKLQDSPLEIGTAVVPLSTQPNLPTTATYSISMDLNIAETSPSWRVILESTDGTDWVGGRPNVNTRRPLIGITGNDAPPYNQIFVNHTGSDSAWQGDGLWLNGVRRTGADFTLGQWFNWTVTMDSTAKVGKVYINGTKKGEFTVDQPFVWPNPRTTWTWNNTTYGNTGSIKVANAYFFTSVLTDTQVSKLVLPSAPTPGVASTSYYTAQPLSMGTSAYVKEMYMNY